MSSNEKFDVSRSPVPPTSSLIASIIAEADGLQQHPAEQTKQAKPVFDWRRFFQMAMPVTACCVIAVVIVIGSSPKTNNGSESDPSLASEELDWQEILLVEDEWLLADL